MEIKPIAHIYTDFSEKFGIPRQSGRVKELKGRIVFEDEYKNPDALRGIEEFSHLWLIFDFSESHRDTFSPTVRPPRLGGNTHVGVFASRSPFRPNSMGLSVVKLEMVEDTDLVVLGVDLLSGTPIYDIKPYIPYSDSIPDAKGSYADKEKDHSLKIYILPEIQEKISVLMTEDEILTVKACIADDPRPSYQEDKDRIYKMHYKNYDVSFTVDIDSAVIVDVIKL